MEIMSIITTLSVIAALGAIYSASRVHRRERERSAARVASLSAAAAAQTSIDSLDMWEPESLVERRPHERRVDVAPDRQAAPAAAGAPGVMFGTVEREASSSGRSPMMAAAVLIAALGSVLF